MWKKDCGCPLHDSRRSGIKLLDYQPIMLILDDGTALCPAADDELNNAGSLVHYG